MGLKVWVPWKKTAFFEWEFCCKSQLVGSVSSTDTGVHCPALKQIIVTTIWQCWKPLFIVRWHLPGGSALKCEICGHSIHTESDLNPSFHQTRSTIHNESKKPVFSSSFIIFGKTYIHTCFIHLNILVTFWTHRSWWRILWVNLYKVCQSRQGQQ